MYGLISNIVPHDPSTWKGKVFLTLDIDWAHDDVLSYCIDLFEISETPATWFITHDTPLLERLRSNRKFELGIHPNFNPLLDGIAKSNTNASTIIQDLLAIVPEATAVRSHSLVHGERLVDTFHEFGLTHLSNTFIPDCGMKVLSPWSLWADMVVVPHRWQDNVSMRLNEKMTKPLSLTNSGLSVLNFHPIHVFLNSDTIFTYEAARPYFRDPIALHALVNHTNIGAKDVLVELLENGL